MNSNLKVFIPLVLAVVVGSVVYAFSQTGTAAPPPRPPHGPHGGPGGPAGLSPRALDQLNLTDSQKQQIQAYLQAAREQASTNESTLRQADEQLRALVEGGSFTDKAASALIKTKTDALAQLELIQLRTHAAIYKLLTADQRAQLSQLRPQRPPMPPPPPPPGVDGN